jgi:hypothetical protein
MNFPTIASLMFILSSGLTAISFRDKFKRSYPKDSKSGSVKLKYLYVCCLIGFLITGLTLALLRF